MKTERHDGWNRLRGMGRLALIGCMMLISGFAAGAEDLSTWQKRIPIVFSGYTPPGGGETLTNFPVLVILSNTTTGAEFNYNDFQSPPYGDLRFAAGDKTTPLDFEVESWDTNGLSYVWVRVPELTVDTAIYALWKKSEVGVPVCTTNGATWMNDFSGVWHLSETNGVTTDSSSNRVSSVITGAGVQGAVGQMGCAYQFNGNNSYVSLSMTLGTTVTISAWARNTATTPSDMLWSRATYSPDLWFSNGSLYLNAGDSYGNLFCTQPTGLAQFHHYVTVIDATQTKARLYIDGRLVSSTANYKNPSGTPLKISSGCGYDWHGVIDEFVVASIPLSSNWIWASYMNTVSNGVFNTYGAPESQAMPGVANATHGATNVTSSSAWLSGTLMSTGFSETAVFAYWGPTDGGTDASAWANTNTWAAPQMPGDFTTQATGLSANSTYYYRFAASNAAGWAWASEASVFITGEVWIEKTADASEDGPTPGTFTVHRAAAATNEALMVIYTVGGTATPGVDYMALSGTIMIPVGETNAVIEVMPIFDHFLEGTEMVVVTLTSGPYMIGLKSHATVGIEDYGQVTRTWSGGGANELASTAANWVEGEAPITGDAIVLQDDGTNKNMTWDLDLPVQSWTQDGYAGTVTVATVYPGQGAFTNFAVLGNCVISNGVWTQTANPAVNYEVNRLYVVVGGDLIIGPDGAIDVSGKGYAAQKGPGHGSGSGGGGYGGRGCPYWGTPEHCYGSIVAPANLGSGGYTKPGGGALMLNVRGEVRHEGLIAADGFPSTTSGSGGSVWLTCGALSGSGDIRADGGYHATHSGGGGRMALVVTNAGANFSFARGVFSARGWGSASVVGGAGTVYLRTASQGINEGTLIVDNGGLVKPGYTEINSNVTDTVVGDVIVRNNAYLLLDTNQILTVSGVWSNGATLLAQSGSQVILAGAPASTSVLYGSTMFMGLICTNPGGKTILFEAGKTNTIVADGQLTWMGDATTNLILRSTSDGVSWKLNVNGSVAQSVRYVDVKNSDALPGASIGAFTSIDSGDNLNWVFPALGQTNIWTGANNTAWNLSANWSRGHAPLTEDFVLIPSACPRYPVLDTAKTLTGGLKIETGAALSLAGYNLTVKTNAVIAGTLKASNAETIAFLANVDFASGAFTPADSTLVVGGTGNQIVNLDNLSCYRVNVVNSSGTVTFGSGFSAGELRCEAPDGARSFVFQQGENYILRSLVLLGSPATTNIALRSASVGQKWNLNVTGGATAVGVDVRDSNALGGKPIRAIASKDSSGNSNWCFEENWTSWVGANGASFSVASNWLPAGVPGVASRVSIHGGNKAVLASPVTVLELIVGGSLTVSTNLTVVEDLTVQSGGRVTLDRPVVVSNDVYVLAGGTLTHSPNAAAEANKLNLTVRGDMNVDTNAVIDVTGKGYSSRGGPGYDGSYGGRAAKTWAGGGHLPCYGSILAPTNLGSGGVDVSGGGAMLLQVSGTFHHNGLLVGDGLPAACASSGGSIWLTCGAMNGVGPIRAQGGAASAGGGRISLVLADTGADFTSFTGPVTVYGGGTGAGAGTIYKQCATDRPGRGLVEIKNNSKAGFTDVPSFTNGVAGEADRAIFRLADGSTLRLTDDFTVGDIWLNSANSWLDLGSNTLTVNAREHDLGLGTVVNEGAIIWTGLPPGVLIIVK